MRPSRVLGLLLATLISVASGVGPAHAQTAAVTFTIFATADVGGTITPSGAIEVNQGANQSFTITPNPGYHILNVFVDSAAQGPVSSYTFTNVNAFHSIFVTFAVTYHTLAVDIDGSGSVTKDPDLAQYVEGTTVQLTAVPGVGFAFVEWSGDAAGNANPLDLVMSADKAVTASFVDIAPPAVTVVAPNGGEVFPSDATVNLQWSATDNAAVTAVDLLVSRGGAGGPYEAIATGIANSGSYMWAVTGPITSDALFKAVAHDAAGNVAEDVSDGSFTLSDWIITATGTAGGTISPSGVLPVSQGADLSFTITPDVYHHITDVLVDGVPVGAVTGYTFTSVGANHTIAAGFAQTTHALSVTVNGGGLVTRVPDLTVYPEGSTVELTATPDPGSVFVGWSGDATGTTNPLTLAIDADRAVTATFIVADVLQATATTFPTYSAGALPPAWGDYDNDGDVDLPLGRNDGGGTFSEIPGFRTLLDNGNFHGASWCDFDRDGDLDLALQPFSPLPQRRALLLRNQGDGSFVDVAPTLGMDVSGYGATAVWGDFDADGWPDLFMPYYAYASPYQSFLYHNNGNGTFTDVAAVVGVDLSDLPSGLNPEGGHAADYDDDGDLDLYCASHLFANNGSGSFTDVRGASGLPVVSDGCAMFVDYDNDGDLDLYLRTAPGPRLFRNDAGQFTEVTGAAGLTAMGFAWGDNWADVDNDGDVDLYLVVNGQQPARLMMNLGNGTFVQDPTFNVLDSSGLTAWADDDRDGDLDLRVDGNDRHRLANTLDGRPGFAGSYVRVVVVDANGRRTQHGATVRLRRVDGPPGVFQTRVVDGGSGYLTQSEYTAHFGVVPGGTYALSVSFPSHPASRVVVDETQVAWLGSLVPATLGGQTITVYRDGRARLGDWIIAATAGTGGTITPSGAVAVSEGTNRTFTIAAAAGHYLADVLVDGTSVGPLASYTFTNVTAAHTIDAIFAVIQHTLTVNVTGGGSVTKDPDLASYPEGSTVELTPLPAIGFAFTGWSGDATGSANPLDLVMDTDKSVTAIFSPIHLTETNTSFPAYSAGSLPPAWGDYDNDGDLDLPLIRNNGDGTFGEIPGLRAILNDGNYHGASWCDYDRDGDVDLVLLPYNGVEGLAPGLAEPARPEVASAAVEPANARLLLNQGDGSFVDVAASLGMAVSGFGETAVWGDFDGDGWPDLFTPYYSHVAPFRSYLFHNSGDGTFTEVAATAGVDLAAQPEALKPEGAQAVDYDDDGDLDLYCASHLFVNDGNGMFTDMRAQVGLPLAFDEGSMFVDYDNDGDLDLYLRLGAPKLYRNDAGSFTEVSAAAGLSNVGFDWGDTWADVDNDGDLDLYLVLPSFQPAHLMLNQGNGTFVRDPTFNVLDSSGLNAWADDDGDGDLDLHVEAYDRHRLENVADQRPGFAGSYVRVLVVDGSGRRTQHGATVRLRRVDGPPGVIQTRVVDSGSGYLTQSEYVVHFGVAPNGTYALSVSFPSHPASRVVVDETQVAWLGSLVPATLNGQTITVYRDGQARLGDWIITATAGTGGTITPSGAVAVSEGTHRTFTIAPDVGYVVGDVEVDGTSVGPLTSYSFTSVTADHTIAASFVASFRTLTLNIIGGGSVMKTPDLAGYPVRSLVTLTAVPDPGFAFAGWGGDASGTTNPLLLSMSTDRVVTATFALVDLFQPSAATFTPGYGAGGLPPAWGDYDNDGDVDLPLYRNDGPDVFSEIPGFRALLNDGNYHGASWCDHDRDGDLDLVLQPYSGTNQTRARLLRNQGDGTFVDIAPSLGIDISGYGSTAVWGDFDSDGWPDLFAPYYAYAAPYQSFLYRNNGNGTFTDVASTAGVDLSDLPSGLNPEGAHAADYDDDGDLDLYCASHLFVNDGSGLFTDVRAQAGLPQVSDGCAMFVDYDDDGDLDLYLRTGPGPRLFRNDAGQFTDVSAAAGLTDVAFGWGDSWADVDHDGDLDLYLVLPSLQSAHLMLNRGDGTFVRDPTFDILDSSGLTAWADDDQDGDLDLHVEGNARHRLDNTLDSRPGFPGSYVRVVVLDGNGRRTQHGATVRLRRVDGPPGVIQTRVVDGGSGYLSQGEYTAHFGVAPGGTYALSVSFPSPPGSRVVVDETQAAWLGSLVPASLGGQTITVFRDGRAHLGDWIVTASAGPNGTITPSGAVAVSGGTNRTFTITPDAGYDVADVVVDGTPVGPSTSYTFTDVTADHTIAASFGPGQHTIVVDIDGVGTVTKEPDLASYPAWTTVALTAVPGPGFAFTEWSGDASGSANPLDLVMDADKSVAASFADVGAPSVTVVAPNGGESFTPGADVDLQWTASDNAAVTTVDLLLSRGGAGGSYEVLAAGIANSGTHVWTAAGAATSDAVFKVVAHDAAGNAGEDASDATFLLLGTTGVEALTAPVPGALTLGPVQPNPMREQARIAFGLPVAVRVRLQILDLQGREVATLADDALPAGSYAMTWDGRRAGRPVPTGMYFVRLQAGERHLVRRLVVAH